MHCVPGIDAARSILTLPNTWMANKPSQNYLTVVIEDNGPALLAAALGDIARARGMGEIAKASGITREALHRALRPDAQPRFDTINRVCVALGLRLIAQRKQRFLAFEKGITYSTIGVPPRTIPSRRHPIQFQIREFSTARGAPGSIYSVRPERRSFAGNQQKGRHLVQITSVPTFWNVEDFSV